MNENTVFVYENHIGRLVFASDTNLWVADIDGISSTEIDLSDSRSVMQVGATLVGQSVRPRRFTIDGSILEPVEHTRGRMLEIIAPQVLSRLTIKQNGESWYLDVVPEKTPELTAGEGIQFFQLRLYAAYPYWSTTEQYNKQVVGLDKLFRFPFFTGGRWWISKYSDNFFASIDNTGNIPIGFVATFIARAQIENPELYHMGMRKQILIRKKMVAGERVIVSTIYGEKTVTCISNTGVATNGFRFLSISSDLSMALLPGTNLFRADASYNKEGMSVLIRASKGVKAGV